MATDQKRLVVTCTLLISALYCCAPPAADAAASVSGRVTDVTLYRGQAQVTRTVPLPEGTGSLEVVVGNLPEQVVPNSLFAEGSDAVEIRAVRFRTRAVGEQPREEVRQLDQQIRRLMQQLELAKKRQHLLQGKSEYLGKLESFVAPTAHADLAKGVLDAEALERLTTFAFDQRERIVKQEVEIEDKMHELGNEIELAQRKRAEITRSTSQTIREAVLFIEKHAAGPSEVRLNYLVGSCGWSPNYTVRCGGDRGQVRLEYNALIHQLTGEDWNDVTLTLSTASPTLSAAGPGLAPFHVTLAAETPAIQQQAPAFGRGGSVGQVMQQVEGLMNQRQSLSFSANQSVMFDDRTNLNWDLNIFACAYQQLEINGDATTLGVLRGNVRGYQDGPSLSYELPGSLRLASRSDQQMVRIIETDMASRFYHVAVPVLNSYVFREAEVVNAGDTDLLAGPVTVYLDGRFVGRSEIPTVARGQTFVVGFGANPQLRARRELVNRTDDLQGGNRETQIDYRLVIENYTDEPTPVRLIDRLPLAENGADIRVTLGETSDPISSDKLYQRQERPLGILRWDVEVAANASGETARLVEYQYTVEYDRKYVVALPAAKQTLQEDFKRLERGRQKR